MAKGADVKRAAQSFFTEEPEAEAKQVQAVVRDVTPEETKDTGKAPDGYKLNPVYIEVKSKRVQLVFQPSLLKEAKAEAKRRKTSLNELVHIALRELLEKQE
jgi:hypothetical protein